MDNNIIWKYVNEQLTNQEISQVEDQLNIKFPKDYLEVVINNDGGYPSPNDFILNHSLETFNNLISFKTTDSSNIIETIEAVSDRLIEGVIPFGEDPGGNLICFDYRNNTMPTVVFWDHEIAGGGSLDKAISFVCENFTEFMDMLHEAPEE